MIKLNIAIAMLVALTLLSGNARVSVTATAQQSIDQVQDSQNAEVIETDQPQEPVDDTNPDDSAIQPEYDSEGDDASPLDSGTDGDNDSAESSDITEGEDESNSQTKSDDEQISPGETNDPVSEATPASSDPDGTDDIAATSCEFLYPVSLRVVYVNALTKAQIYGSMVSTLNYAEGLQEACNVYPGKDWVLISSFTVNFVSHPDYQHITVHFDGDDNFEPLPKTTYQLTGDTPQSITVELMPKHRTILLLDKRSSQPLEGATVSVGDVTGTTDANGNFRYRSAEAQDNITISKTGWQTLNTSCSSAKWVCQVQMTQRTDATVTVVVTDKQTGAPLRGITVSLIRGDSERHIKETGSDGRAVFTNLRPDKYTCSTFSMEYWVGFCGYTTYTQIAVNDGDIIYLKLSKDEFFAPMPEYISVPDDVETPSAVVVTAPEEVASAPRRQVTGLPNTGAGKNRHIFSTATVLAGATTVAGIGAWVQRKYQ